MFFKRKAKKEEVQCSECNAMIAARYKFCPECGSPRADPQREMKEFGMLGRSDIADQDLIQQAFTAQMSMADRLLGSLMKTLMRNLNAQVSIETTEVRSTPNGVRIRTTTPHSQQKRREARVINRPLSDEQLARISSLPRAEAKTSVRRFSDKVVYEVAAPGVQSTDDVFFSKTESGYELKALAKNKLYTSNLPLNLPLRGFAISDKGLIVEFALR